MTNVGLVLRGARERKGWKQDDVVMAVRSKRPDLKLSVAQVSNYERGKNTPRLDTLSVLAEVLDEPLDSFRQKPAGDDEDEESDLFRLADDLETHGQIDMADELRARARRVSAKKKARRSPASQERVAAVGS